MVLSERRTVVDLLTAARARLARLEPAAAHEAIARGALAVDTRCTDSRRTTGVIPGSVHIPLSVLYWRLAPGSGRRNVRLADRDRQVIVVCAHGYSSSLAAATLIDLGFTRATDLAGGYEAWAAAGLPIEAAPD